MAEPEIAAQIDTQEELRAHYGEVNYRARLKQLPKLEKHSKRFISLSPFFVLSTASGKGTDASPRGDAPGFVKILDDRTLAIPDRPGNNRVDSFSNILENPSVGLLFLVPGINETLRVNGRARITTDPAVLAGHAFQGKLPRSVMLVEVEEVFLHCAKALMRSKLWDPARHVDRKDFPSMGECLAEQIGGGLDPRKVEEEVFEGYRKNLY
ncbi:MAG: pyridoxamine 5'-phosphate oxidase family protein [Candidatus Tectomicrobia bacterium]|uniref:Pyridoxamine 5'-phosphate oxidase family protein n=1 Tax=Tectimicrobiota bacterium TaxID=2528274 RepID=A0A932I4G3_UNCTE|nr:pyridoxamine 5'-phosphate oxidase family protein [Candidatus Tectomicrobia bacterium]